MTDAPRSPVLVLGLGNLLLHDDGVGLSMLSELQQEYSHDPRVEFVDGGTQGLALMPVLTRQTLVRPA